MVPSSTISLRLIHRLIEARALMHPGARAVVHEGTALSYGELDARANRLAHHLVACGVGSEVIVGVHMDRTLELVVAMLAVMKAGGAYVPLDPNYPDDRNAFMLADSGARVVITDGPMGATFSGACVDVRADADLIARQSSEPVAREIDGDNPAYIIYTSGSTGRPKGVMVPHDRVVRLMTSTEQWFGFDERDVWTFFHSYAFDFSVWEIWGALIYGGSVVVVPEAVRRSPDDLLALLSRERVTVLNQIPSAFRHLIASATRGGTIPLALRYVIFGGEALELRGLVPWFERYPVQPALINMYGITETTVHVTYRKIDPAECAAPRGSPIGVPIPDLELYVLDAALRPVEVDGEGELYVGGKGLARGYHARPSLTAERFVPDPFSGRAGDRLYKTGDLARRLGDGSFEYLGRNDAQVKIRGYRIETGEIASILATHPAVREAAVVVKEVDGDKRLVGYVALTANADAALESLREHAKQCLPSYMIPSAFVIVDSLPLTPSGKVDAKALPDPDWSAAITAFGARAGYVAPSTDDERTIATLWSSLLGVASIGRHDRFFELGGHSLVAAQVSSRLAADTGVSVPVRLFLSSPTVEEAATGFAEARMRQSGHVARVSSRLPQRQNSEQAPLSFAQEAIWIHEQVMRDVLGKPRGYVECPALQLRGPLQPALLERALNEIAARHEIWRTGVLLGEEPYQKIARSARIAIRSYDRRTTDAGAQRRELEEIAEALTAQPFAIDRSPLVRCALVAFGPEHHVLVLAMHHLITDAWSESLIAAEVARLYAFLVAGDPLPPRTEIETQYGDWAAWERSDDNAGACEAAREFWRHALAGAPEPLGLPAFIGDAGTRPIRLAREIDATLGQRLAAFSRKHNVSASTVIYAAFVGVLKPYAVGQRFVLGIASSNRSATTERLPGCLTGVMPVTVDLSSGSSLVAIAQQLRTSIADAAAFGGVPLPELARIAGRKRGAPLVQVQVSTQLPAQRHRGGPLVIDQDYVPVNDAKFALELVVVEREDRSIELGWIADPQVLSASAVQNAASELERILTAEIAEPPTDEVVLQKLWGEVLRVPRVGVRDDFFELGGHSLLAIKLVAKIRAALSVEVTIGQLFASPTIEQFVAEITRMRGAAAPLVSVPRVPRDGLLRLSNAQERMWFVERMLHANSPRPFNTAFAIEIQGSIDARVLAQSLAQLVERHEILRTTFKFAGRHLVQVIGAPFLLPLDPLPQGPLTGADRARQIDELATALARAPFDLAKAPLIRAQLLTFGPDDQVLLLVMHHIVFDGTTVGVIVDELAALYGGVTLPPIDIQYVDIAAWQLASMSLAETERQLAYWRDHLAGAPLVEIPRELPPPAVPSSAGDHIAIEIPRASSDAIRLLARSEAASPFMAVVAALVAMIAKRTGVDDIVIGTVATMRDRPELERALGPLLNVLALRVDVSGDPGFRELLRRVRTVVSAAFSHRDVPFEAVVASLSSKPDPKRRLFQFAVSVDAAPPKVAAPPGQTWTLSPRETGAVADDVSLELRDDGVTLAGTLGYKTEVFTRETAESLSAQLVDLLARGAADPDAPLSRL